MIIHLVNRQSLSVVCEHALMGDAVVPLTAPALPSDSDQRCGHEGSLGDYGSPKRCLMQPRKGFLEETWDLRIISEGDNWPRAEGRVFQAEGTVNQGLRKCQTLGYCDRGELGGVSRVQAFQVAR